MQSQDLDYWCSGEARSRGISTHIIFVVVLGDVDGNRMIHVIVWLLSQNWKMCHFWKPPPLYARMSVFSIFLIRLFIVMPKLSRWIMLTFSISTDPSAALGTVSVIPRVVSLMKVHCPPKSSPLGRNDRLFADDIFKYISLNENAWISLRISLKFVPRVRIVNILELVQIMAWHRIGDKP